MHHPFSLICVAVAALRVSQELQLKSIELVISPRYHLELLNQVKGLARVEVHGPEHRLYVYLLLLLELVLGQLLQVGEGLVQEASHVRHLQQDLSVRVGLHKGYQLCEYLVYVLYLVSVSLQVVLNIGESLVFSLVLATRMLNLNLLFKIHDDLVLLLLQAPHQVRKPLLYVLHLL